jgi:nucleotide-binding universal stress UspA family protein
MEIGRIIVGVDGSDDARRAAAWAATLAGAVGAEVVVVHALGLLHRTASGATVASDLHREDIRTELEAAWCAPLRDAGVAYRAELREGNPVTALLDAAGDADADLLVVGSRGVGGFPGLMLGSTSTQLAQHTRRPLVIVPEKSEPGSGQ